MTATSPFEAVAGLLLVFFLPGFTTTRAVFPEWRIRGAEAWRRGVETVTLSFVLSLGWTVVVGYGLLSIGPSGFQASWSDPALEVALIVVFLVTFVVGWWQGAYSRAAPVRARPAADPGGEGAWELTRDLDRLAREERRVEHALRVAGRSGSDSARLEEELTALRKESSRLQLEREREYAE
jgi:hypothetical protein